MERKSWIKLVGDSKNPPTGNYLAKQIGFRRKGKPSIREGDYLFIYAPGGSKRIFALVEALGEAEPDPNFDEKNPRSCRWKLNVSDGIRVPVESGVLIDVIDIHHRLMKAVRTASHISLHEEESKLAHSEFTKLKTQSVGGV